MAEWRETIADAIYTLPDVPVVVRNKSDWP